MLKGISEVIKSIINELNSKPCSDDGKINLWDMTVHQIKNKDSVDGRYYDSIQGIVNEHISQMKDDEVIIVWKETETGINRDYEPEDVPIDSLKFDLEEELMDEITKIAWSETEHHTWH